MCVVVMAMSSVPPPYLQLTACALIVESSGSRAIPERQAFFVVWSKFVNSCSAVALVTLC
jgi:hypothetical protein